MVVESVKNETYFPLFLEGKEVPAGHRVPEGKFAYNCARCTLYNDIRYGHHFLMCTEELSALQALRSSGSNHLERAPFSNL